MSRRNPQRGDRRAPSVKAVGGIAQQFAALFAGQADAVFLESDNYNSGAGTWTDKLDPTHIMTATGTIAAPAVTARFTGANIVLSGTQFLTSNRAASRFKRMHSGQGCTVLGAYAMTSVGSSDILWSTFASGTTPGAYQFALVTPAPNAQWAQVKTGGDAYNTTAVASGIAAATAIRSECLSDTTASPQNTFATNGIVRASGAYASAADTSNNTQTLLIGSLLPAGANQLHAEVRGFYMLPYLLSASQLVTARAYMAAL